MTTEWYYARDGQRFGPFSQTQLEQLAVNRQLQPSDHIWRPGLASWALASTLPGLFESLPLEPVVAAVPVEALGAAFLLSSLALRGMCGVLMSDAVGGIAGGAVDQFRKCCVDQSKVLARALARSNQRAWKTLEMALAGESFWDRVKERFSRAEEQAFLQEIRQLLLAVELPGGKDIQPFCKKCLQELREARNGKDLAGGTVKVQQLVDRATDFDRFDSPHKQLDAEWQLVASLAEQLRPKFPNLAWLLSRRPTDGQPLLVLAVRYYFRREVEENDELFRGLTFAKMESISEQQGESFAWLINQGEKLEELLNDLKETVEQTHGGVLRIEEEMRKQGPQIQQIYQMLIELQNKLDLSGAELPAHVSVSIRTDEEKKEVKAFLQRYRSMPAAERQARPALIHAAAKLEVAAGEFDAAQKDFTEVATLVSDGKTQAEVHYNRYLSYLEQKQWGPALDALREAAALHPDRYAPFPLHKYQPRRILGTGGFGVVFLCENVHTGAQVVLKTLRTEGTGMDVRQVFREARLLGGLQHPAIIQLFDCDFADAAQTRAYLVMEYFDTQTLEQLASTAAAPPLEAFVPLALQMAEGLQAAHERGVLHRDIKPANILIRQHGSSWQIKLIDFGLAVRQEVEQAQVKTRRSLSTATGSELAGTLDYASPEQMGRLPGVKVGPYSDVYGFGKTCCHVLFKTTNPLPRHFRPLPEALTLLLEDCLEEEPMNRPHSFAEVVRRLQKVQEELAAGVPPEQSAKPAASAPPTLPPALEPAAPPVPAAALWHYIKRGKTQGPISEAALVELITRGQVQPTDLVWRAGMADWVPAAAVPQLVPRVETVLPAAENIVTEDVILLEEEEVTLPGKATGIIHLDGLGGTNSGGELDVYIGNDLIGTGSAILGIHLNFETVTGHQAIRIKGRNTGFQAFIPGKEQVFPIHLRSPGRYKLLLSFEGVTGFFLKTGATGATVPNKLKVLRIG